MKRDSAFALVLTVFLLLFFALIFIAFADLLTTDTKIVENHKKDMHVLYIAEAGIEYAISNLRDDDTWTSSGGTPIEFPPGSGNNYTVTYPVDFGKIRSVGTLSGGVYSKTIEVAVALSGGSPPYKVTVLRWEEI